MNTMEAFSPAERDEIRELFGLPLEQLDADTLKKTLRELRARYHPDNFEKFGDDTVRQLATERFQRIERMAEKIQALLEGRLIPDAPGRSQADPVFDPRARFAFREMKIEIRTSDKDLKYHLFGTFYRWLTLGDKFKIPDTGEAYIIADEEHLGRSIGFVETIRFYLSFDEKDRPETIVDWLFHKIEGRADALLIESEIVPIEYAAILLAVKRRSLKLLS